jgi:hypothetical protein
VYDTIPAYVKHKLGGENKKKMKRKITLLRLTIVIAILASVGVVMALIPPPPAEQKLGIYDTVYSGFDEAGCRDCHSSGVPNTHHLLVQNAGYKCTDCHPPGPNGGVVVIRDCVECHTASPHHKTDAALERYCSKCHGSFVNDYDDGHYIPTYSASLVTPDTSYRYINCTTGKKWGGCEACHEPDASMSPVINANPDTHHAAVSAITCASGGLGNICHFDPIANIRKCEECHGVNSIHNIQYDYNNTKGKLGYGHIGDAWDCMGCHAWYEAYKGDPPVDPIIVPFMASITPSSLVTGEETVVTIVGDNFVTTVDGTTYTCNVDVDDEVLEPNTITATEIKVTIPGLDAGNYGLYLIKAGLRSNMLPIVAAPVVIIDSVTVDKSGTSVTIEGKGFGNDNPKHLHPSLGLWVDQNDLKVKKIPVEATVYKWTENEIRFSYPESLGSKATVTIRTEYDNATAKIAGDT